MSEKTCENCGADKSKEVCTDCGMDVSNGPEPMYILTRWEPKGDYHAKQMATIEMFMDDLTTVNRMELLSLINRAEVEGERKAKEKASVDYMAKSEQWHADGWADYREMVRGVIELMKEETVSYGSMEHPPHGVLGEHKLARWNNSVLDELLRRLEGK